MRSARQLLVAQMGMLALAVNAPVAMAALTLDIIPAAPRYQEAVVARLTRPPLDFGVIYGATTAMQGNSIIVTYYQYPELSTASHDVSLGQLPAGLYRVELHRSGADVIEASTQFTVGSAPVPSPLSTGGRQVPSVNFSGQWWNAAEPGWGLALTQGPTHLVFAEWFVHDDNGQPVWLTLEPGEWTNAETFMTYTGPILRTPGSWWAVPYAPRATGLLVGTGTLSFRDAYTGTLDFVVDGVRTVKPITRLPIE